MKTAEKNSAMATRQSDGRATRTWYSLDDPTCPEEGSDAGESVDYLAELRRRRIQRERRAARREFDNSKRRLTTNRVRAEEHARAALQLGAQAYWLAEETEFAEREHRTLYKMGRWVRTNFGCELAYDGQYYEQRCPVAIANKRLGMSPGFVARRWCSICDHDLSECPHRSDRLYWVRGYRHSDGACAVCTHNDCKHRPDRLYRTPVISVIKEVDELREISFVDVPAQPFARLTALPVDPAGLRKSLGADFYPGMPVSCDTCLSEYRGLPVALDPANEDAGFPDGIYPRTR